MSLTPEQKIEKATQHLIAYAQYLAQEYCNGDVANLMRDSADRVSRVKDATEQPAELAVLKR